MTKIVLAALAALCFSASLAGVASTPAPMPHTAFDPSRDPPFSENYQHFDANGTICCVTDDFWQYEGATWWCIVNGCKGPGRCFDCGSTPKPTQVPRPEMPENTQHFRVDDKFCCIKEDRFSTKGMTVWCMNNNCTADGDICYECEPAPTPAPTAETNWVGNWQFFETSKGTCCVTDVAINRPGMTEWCISNACSTEKGWCKACKVPEI